MKGLKISLEGIDGAGKTTQTERVKGFLEQQGHDVLFKPCRNNTFTAGIDNDILQLIKRSGEEFSMLPAAEVLLTAARTLIVHEGYLKEHLSSGGTVLCDRDIDTTIAYSLPQLKRSYPDRSTAQLAGWIMDTVSIEQTTPDLTILFDVDPSIAVGRALSDDNPQERAVFSEHDVTYIKEVSSYYKDLRQLYPERIQRIDVSEMSIQEVGSTVLHTVSTFLDEYRSVA